MRKHLKIATALALVVLVTACAAGVNPAEHVPDSTGHVSGIFAGFWHGLIVPITLVISFFTNSVQIYDVHNNGGWYDLGFVFGAASALGGGGTTVVKVVRVTTM